MSDDISIPPPGTYNQRRFGEASDPGTYRLVRIAFAILAVGGVGVLATSLLHVGSTEVPVIRADDRPIRERPPNTGVAQTANAEAPPVANTADATRLAPAPEAPNPGALRAPPPTPAAVAPASVTPAPATVVAATPPKPKPAPVVAAPAAVPAVHGKAVIQLAAVGSEAAAHTEWQSLQKRLPDVLAGHQPTISKTERDGKTYWRLRTAGFGDVAQAKAACEKVRAKGGACSVAEF